MRTFTLNGKEYKARAFDFNLMCDLEDMGVAIAEIGKKPMTVLRAYIAICGGMSVEAVGKEMEAHIVDGGAFDEVMTVMGAEMDASDFFRNLSKRTEKGATKSKSEKK